MKYIRVDDGDNNSYYINPKTGELLEIKGTVYIETAEQKLKRREYFQQKQTQELAYHEIQECYSEYGSFTWYFYRINQISFPNLSALYLVRLMMLATYVDYNGILRNRNHSLIAKKDLRYLLDISEREVFSFVSALEKQKILLTTEIDNHIALKLNRYLFAKGKLAETTMKYLVNEKMTVTRLYAEGIRNVYLETIPSKRKHLGYIFKLLPYVNKRYNIVCYNPDERNQEKICPILSERICEILDYDASQKNRLFNSLLKIQFRAKNTNYSIMQRLVFSEEDKIESMFIINPHIYYAGNDWNEVSALAVNKFKKQRRKKT